MTERGNAPYPQAPDTDLCFYHIPDPGIKICIGMTGYETRCASGTSNSSNYCSLHEKHSRSGVSSRGRVYNLTNSVPKQEQTVEKKVKAIKSISTPEPEPAPVTRRRGRSAARSAVILPPDVPDDVAVHRVGRHTVFSQNTSTSVITAYAAASGATLYAEQTPASRPKHSRITKDPPGPPGHHQHRPSPPPRQRQSRRVRGAPTLEELRREAVALDEEDEADARYLSDLEVEGNNSHDPVADGRSLYRQHDSGGDDTVTSPEDFDPEGKEDEDEACAAKPDSAASLSSPSVSNLESRQTSALNAINRPHSPLGTPTLTLGTPKQPLTKNWKGPETENQPGGPSNSHTDPVKKFETKDSKISSQPVIQCDRPEGISGESNPKSGTTYYPTTHGVTIPDVFTVWGRSITDWPKDDEDYLLVSCGVEIEFILVPNSPRPALPQN